MEETTKNKKIGLLIMCLATIGFFFFFAYFDQSGTEIQYRNLNYMLKTITTTAFLPLGLYFGLYFYGGKKLAMQIGGWLALLLILSYLIGFITH